MAQPKPAPNLHIPRSDHTVSVSIIDTTAHITCPSGAFMQPDGLLKNFVCPCYSFLIKHDNPRIRSKYDTLLFDLGVAKDFLQNGPKEQVKTLKASGFDIKVEKNVAEILLENDIALKDVGGVIWSHHHFDHTGDVSTFPPNTDLLVGPGFKANLLPGYPEDPASSVLSANWADRTLIEVSFSRGNTAANFMIGQFRAHDFFHDGSLYLLDTPGHAVGHMCALARVKGGDDPEFILMGGDIAHHAGQFRPTEYVPLPDQIQLPSLSPSSSSSVPSPENERAESMTTCPGEIFERIHPTKSHFRTTPFLQAEGPAHHDRDEVKVSIQKWQDFDAQENIFAVIAHDESLKDVLEFLGSRGGGSADGWRAKGWKQKGRWRFLKDFDVEDGKEVKAKA